MVTRKSLTIGAAALSLVVILVAIISGRGKRQDYAADLETDFARNLSVDVDGSPFPAEIRLSQPYPLRIRFQRAADAPSMDQYVLYAMVVGKRGYGSKTVDSFDAIQQQPKDRNKNPEPDLGYGRGQRPMEISPEPPSQKDPALQYTVLISADSFRYNRDWGEPLELHLWAYPKVAPKDGKGEAGEPAHLIYRQPFRVVPPR